MLIGIGAVPTEAHATISNVQPVNIKATAGVQFSGAVATFQSGDAGPFEIQVNWGDGSAPSSQQFSPKKASTYDGPGAHTYRRDGSYKVSVTVTDTSDKTVGTTTGTAKVALAKPQFGVSNQTPMTGQAVVFDLSRYQHRHGGAVGFRMDLNGDGVFERKLGREMRVGVRYGHPLGLVNVGVQIAYLDGTHTDVTGQIDVRGGSSRICGGPAYCHVDFPAAALAGAGSGCQDAVSIGVTDIATLDDDSVAPRLGCFQHSGSTLTTGQPVRVNGVDLYPQLGATLTFDPDAKSIVSSGPVAMQAGEVRLGMGTINWTGLDGTATSTGAQEQSVDAPLGPINALEGFPLTGRGQIRLHRATPGSDGVALIDVFAGLPAALGNESAGVTLAVDPSQGLLLDGLHLHFDAGSVFAFQLPLQNLDFDYSAADDSWSGDLGVMIGDYTVGGSIGLSHGQLTALGASISGLNVSIYAGVFLDGINLHLALSGGTPTDIGGGITLTYGPSYRDPHGNVSRLIALDANFDWRAPPGGLTTLSLNGDLKVIDLMIATFDASYRFDGLLSMDASVRLPWFNDGQSMPNPGLEAEMHGFYYGPSGVFEIEGSGRGCLGICAGADLIGSTVGIAGCLTFDTPFGNASIGGGYTFLDRNFHFPIGCDLAGYRVTRPSAGDIASLTRTFSVARGQRLVGVRVLGRGAPPLVTFVSPTGERITSPTSTFYAKTHRYWLLEDKYDHSTGVVLVHPAAGVWRVEAQPGSAPVSRLETAAGLAPVSVRATVRGRRSHRVLRYHLRQLPGQRVIFFERIKQAGHEIGVAHGSHGTLTFTPAYGPAGRRTVLAVVQENGLPRKQLAVTSFSVARVGPPGRTGRITLRRSKGTVNVQWRAVAGAASYEVMVSTFHSRQQLFRIHGAPHRLSLALIRSSDSVTATVVALAHDGRRGRRAIARLNGGQRVVRWPTGHAATAPPSTWSSIF